MSGVTTAAALRARREGRSASDVAARWRFDRTLSRLAPVEVVLADFATSYWGRALRQRVVAPMESAVELPGVIWSIEDEVIAECIYADVGPSRLVVHELSLFAVVRKRLRTRHITVERGGDR